MPLCGLALMQVDGYTHLYTLVLRPDLSYEVRIDGRVAESGDIEYDWNLESLKSAAKKTATEQRGWEQVWPCPWSSLSGPYLSPYQIQPCLCPPHPVSPTLPILLPASPLDA